MFEFLLKKKNHLSLIILTNFVEYTRCLAYVTIIWPINNIKQQSILETIITTTFWKTQFSLLLTSHVTLHSFLFQRSKNELLEKKRININKLNKKIYWAIQQNNENL